jgi:hypothetical protein
MAGTAEPAFEAGESAGSAEPALGAGERAGPLELAVGTVPQSANKQLVKNNHIKYGPGW